MTITPWIERTERETMRYCPYCMQPIEAGWCPACQKDTTAADNDENLVVGTVLDGKYLIGRSLGQGGFGVTYLARDLTLDCVVAIKEYFPTCWAYRNKAHLVRPFPDEVSAFNHGKESFLREGRLLARVGALPHIVTIRTAFEEGMTCYLVMEYLEGQTLAELVKEKGQLDPKWLLPLLVPLMEDIEKLHQMDPPVLHRDITPGNIMLSHGKLRLIDFGSARQLLGNKSMSAMISYGYAPPEQYSPYNQGTYTDVYALAATVYGCITGKPPQDAASRVLEDRLTFPADLPECAQFPITQAQNNALKHAMMLQYTARTQTVTDFMLELTQLSGKSTPKRSDPRFSLRDFQIWASKKKNLLVAAAATVLVLTLVTGLFLCKSSSNSGQSTTGADGKDETFPVPIVSAEPIAPEAQDNPVVAVVELADLTLIEGQSEILEQAIAPATDNIEWKSDNSSIVMVDTKTGKVHAKAVGAATISATANGVTGRCTVTVVARQVEEISLKSGPTKTDYYVSMPLDTSGIELEIRYNDGKTEVVTSGFEVSGFDAYRAGTQSLSLTWKGMVVGTIQVVVLSRPLLLSESDAGFPCFNFVYTQQYEEQIYYVKNRLDGNRYIYSIYRKDTPDAEPVCICTPDVDYIGNFFILQDRFFFETSMDNNRLIASVDLNGENFFRITEVDSYCVGCYYSNGWIYSYSLGDSRLVRFRTDGSQYEYVGGAEISPYKYCVSSGQVVYYVPNNGSARIMLLDTATGVTTTLKSVEGEYVRLYGLYGDYLLYATSEWPYGQHIYNLQYDSTYTFDSGKTEAVIWNDQIFLCDQDGNAELRSLSNPMTIMKAFQLPFKMLSGPIGDAALVLTTGDYLAFATIVESAGSVTDVVLIDRTFEIAGAFTTLES